MNASTKIPLLRPHEFQRRNRHLFPTNAALYRYLTKRRDNGLLDSGAVVEAPTGVMLIDPARFEKWLRGKRDAA